MTFSCTFPGDIKEFDGNPYHVDTPFGRPVTIGVGDVFDERELLEEVASDLLSALTRCLACIEESTEFKTGNPAFEQAHGYAHAAIWKANENL